MALAQERAWVANCDVCEEPFEDFGATVRWGSESEAVEAIESDHDWYIDEKVVAHRHCRLTKGGE